MLTKSLLDFLLVPARHRFRAGSMPLMVELPIAPDTDPLVVTNTKGHLVVGARSSQGIARAALFECSLEDEPSWIVFLHREMSRLIQVQGWGNRVKTIADGTRFLNSYGLEARKLIVSYDLLRDLSDEPLSPEDVNRLMVSRGSVCEVEGIQVAVAPLPSKSALLSIHPNLSGTFVRTGDRIGVLIQNADRTLVVIEDGIV